jgi:hypothetical protein
MFGSSLHPVGCRRVQSCLEHLLYMCLFAYRGVQHILCGVVFFLFVYLMFCCCFVCLRIVYPMLPVSLDCLSSSCVPNVASLSGLFVFVLCTQCCQSLWIVPSVFSNVYFLILSYRWRQMVLVIRLWFKTDHCFITMSYDGLVVPLVESTSWSFPHSWLITGFVTDATSGAGTVYHSVAPEFTPPFLVGFVLLDL